MASTDWLPLLIQVPLVGIFIVFTLIMLKNFMDFIERRDRQWQSFMEQQGVNSNASITRLENKVDNNTQEVRNLVTLLNTHDARVARREEG
jgi:hypothetical protein